MVFQSYVSMLTVFVDNSIIMTFQGLLLIES